jgi:hypothetical protein
MTHLVKMTLAVLIVLGSAAPAVPQQPFSNALARSLSNLINVFCASDPTFEFKPPDALPFPKGQAKVQADSDLDTTLDSTDGDDIRGLTVTVFHGATSSTHTVIYEDNDGSGSLTCADTILAVA